MSGQVDWPALMRLGLGVRWLDPEVFWSMTPRELEAATSAHRAGRARTLSRSAFDALRERFPDEPRQARERGEE